MVHLQRVWITNRAAEIADAAGAAEGEHPWLLAEIDRWTWMILDDKWTAEYLFEAFARRNIKAAIQVCRWLVWDGAWQVRQAALRLLTRFAPADEAVPLAAQLLYDADWHVRGTALRVIQDSATPYAIQHLFIAAERGNAGALSTLTHLASMAEERRRLLELARAYITSANPRLRHAALLALLHFSDIMREQMLLADVAARYGDRAFIRALARADRVVLPTLQDMLSHVRGQGTTRALILDTMHRINRHTGSGKGERPREGNPT